MVWFVTGRSQSECRDTSLLDHPLDFSVQPKQPRTNHPFSVVAALRVLKKSTVYSKDNLILSVRGKLIFYGTTRMKRRIRRVSSQHDA